MILNHFHSAISIVVIYNRMSLSLAAIRKFTWFDRSFMLQSALAKQIKVSSHICRSHISFSKLSAPCRASHSSGENCFYSPQQFLCSLSALQCALFCNEYCNQCMLCNNTYSSFGFGILESWNTKSCNWPVFDVLHTICPECLCKITSTHSHMCAQALCTAHILNLYFAESWGACGRTQTCVFSTCQPWPLPLPVTLKQSNHIFQRRT